MSIEFFLTTLVVVVTPGTGVLYTVAAGVSRGRRASIVAAVGCTLGIVPHMVAAMTGLAAIMHTSALAFATLKYLGVGYLLFMAWQALRDKSSFVVDDEATPRSAGKVIVSGVMINILNPKLTIFFFAFLPQFVKAGSPHALVSMLQMSGFFMVLTFVVFALYGMFASAVRSKITSRPRVVTWMRRVFAGSYVLLAGRLAVQSK